MGPQTTAQRTVNPNACLLQTTREDGTFPWDAPQWTFPWGPYSLHLGRSKLMAAPRKNSTEFSHRAHKWLVLIRPGPVHTSCFLVYEDANTDCLASASVLWWPLGISCEHPPLLVKVAGSSVLWLLCSSLLSHWLCSQTLLRKLHGSLVLFGLRVFVN